jgi:hypothetical protein
MKAGDRLILETVIGKALDVHKEGAEVIQMRDIFQWKNRLTVAASGFLVISETMIISKAETITIGTTGSKPNTDVPAGVRARTSTPPIDQTTRGVGTAD